ncbi:hypothetical protein WICPIJ_008787 [Wickerhamomyces pijperi]|uniref:Uncharacterized protein n=1 Tax=Wickerhamomyces pijperi TaxID=599730 RepID=A0A9P8PX66_WICPI|nr:hypothetical protein WICPIJ_008787 [Wickerhamomyces pijperi]
MTLIPLRICFVEGEANNSPLMAPVNNPLPMKPACVGSCPAPPPERTDNLEVEGCLKITLSSLINVNDGLVSTRPSNEVRTVFGTLNSLTILLELKLVWFGVA